MLVTPSRGSGKAVNMKIGSPSRALTLPGRVVRSSTWRYFSSFFMSMKTGWKLE